MPVYHFVKFQLLVANQKILGGNTIFRQFYADFDMKTGFKPPEPHWPHIHRTPPEADHKSQATTTHTQPAHQKRTYDGCSRSLPKVEIPRGTPSQKRTGTRHLQQACPKGLGLIHQRHPITPTIPQKYSPENPPRAGTITSTTSHIPPVDQPRMNRSHPTTTINHRRNPSRHENDKVPTKHKMASLHCDPKKS